MRSKGRFTVAVVLMSTFMAMAIEAEAGDNGGGSLSCASASGRTTLNGFAGSDYNGTGAADLVFAIDGVSIHFAASQISDSVRIVDYADFVPGVSYTVGFKRSVAYFSSQDQQTYIFNDSVLKLRSVPGTMQRVRADVYRFDAELPAYYQVDPRRSGDLSNDPILFDQDIRISCTLDVSL